MLVRPLRPPLSSGNTSPKRERSVLPQWPSKSHTKLILMIVPDDRIKITAGIKRMRSEEFIRVAMQLICTGLGNNVHDRTGIAAKFGVKGAREDSKLLYCFRRMLNGRAIHKQIVAVAAVHHVIVRAATSSVDRNHSRIVAAVKQIGAELRLHSRLKLEQLVSITRPQRECSNGRLAHYAAELRALCFDQQSVCADDHWLRLRTKPQGGVKPRHMPDLHLNVCRIGLSKSGGVHAHGICTHRQVGESKFTMFIRLGGMLRISGGKSVQLPSRPGSRLP